MASNLGFTTPQLTTLKADIIAKQGAGQPLEGVTNEETIANYYNALSATSVWRTNTPAKEIADQIDWSKYTPVDSVPSINSLSGNGELHTFIARLLVIQTKQFNMQTLLPKETGATMDTSKANIRGGLRDAVISLPAGASGASISAGGAGGANVLNACVRLARRVEALFASAPVATGPVSAGIMGWEGDISAQFVSDLLGGLLGV